MADCTPLCGCTRAFLSPSLFGALGLLPGPGSCEQCVQMVFPLLVFGAPEVVLLDQMERPHCFLKRPEHSAFPSTMKESPVLTAASSALVGLVLLGVLVSVV